MVMGFKVEFFPLQSNIPGTLLCLIVVGVGSISRVYVGSTSENQ